MDVDWIRSECLSFPHATETVQWGNDLVFKVGGKMFAVACLEPSAHVCSFKCSPEDFTELVERTGIVPAPYLARAQWVALESADALRREECRQLLRKAYDLIYAKLTKKEKAALTT